MSVKTWLRCQGQAVNRKRISRLMKLMGIEAIYPKKRLSPGDSYEFAFKVMKKSPLTPLY